MENGCGAVQHGGGSGTASVEAAIRCGRRTILSPPMTSSRKRRKKTVTSSRRTPVAMTLATLAVVQPRLHHIVFFFFFSVVPFYDGESLAVLLLPAVRGNEWKRSPVQHQQGCRHVYIGTYWTPGTRPWQRRLEPTAWGDVPKASESCQQGNVTPPARELRLSTQPSRQGSVLQEPRLQVLFRYKRNKKNVVKVVINK